MRRIFCLPFDPVLKKTLVLLLILVVCLALIIVHVRTEVSWIPESPSSQSQQLFEVCHPCSVAPYLRSSRLYRPPYFNYTLSWLKQCEWEELHSEGLKFSLAHAQDDIPILLFRIHYHNPKRVNDSTMTDIMSESKATFTHVLVDDADKTKLSNDSCPPIPPGLQGPIHNLNLEPLDWDEMENFYSRVLPGGSWLPEHCKARFKVALLVPFRDREEHLKIFLNNLHPLLMKQELAYTIFVIEDVAPSAHQFNRAALFNVGFLEATKLSGPYDCFVFHDVDLIPEDDRILYSCPTKQPRHLSAAVSVFDYRLPYRNIFGGVSAMMTQHFNLVNGFSNSFRTWGGEDDDMYKRLIAHNLTISRYPLSIARYTMLPHRKAQGSLRNIRLLRTSVSRNMKDGLNSVHYEVMSVEKKKLFTLIKVQINYRVYVG